MTVKYVQTTVSWPAFVRLKTEALEQNMTLQELLQTILETYIKNLPEKEIKDGRGSERSEKSQEAVKGNKRKRSDD